MQTSEKTVSCPRCKATTVYGPENPHRPFCSERCKLIDLGDWAEEKFRIPTEDSSPSLEEESE